MKYSQAPAHPDEILKLIARSASGRDLLSAFLALYRSGQVRIEPYAPDLLSQLREALGEGQPVGACFINDGITGAIHYDPAAPIGVLAPFLVHEMAHATDTTLWVAGRKPQSRRARDRIMLQAEVRAFEAQHQFIQDLRAADLEYGQFLEAQQSRVRVLTERMTENDIAELYGLQ